MRKEVDKDKLSVGLHASNDLSGQATLTTDTETHHGKPGVNNQSHPRGSKIHHTSPSGSFLSASQRIGLSRTPHLAPIDKSTSNKGEKPIITYGSSKSRSEADTSGPCSQASSDTTSSLGKSSYRTGKNQGKRWLNTFRTATPHIHIHLPISRLFSRLRRLFWPNISHHLIRVSWICRCGEPLYIDVHPTQRQAALEYAQAASGSVSSIIVSGATTTGTPPTQTSSSLSSPIDRSGASISDTTEPPPTGPQLTSFFTPPVLAPGTKRYLLLCVNTGHYEIKLEHIDLTNISLDVSLFGLIRDKYELMRGPMVKNIFMAPKTVEYIKFELVRRSSTGECVGNFERNSIPSQVEVGKREYAFSPCPPRIGTIPIQPHIFMHSFMKPGDHLGDLVLCSLPKRVGRKLKCVTQPLNPLDVPYGWGIYIVEGLNTSRISLLLIAVIFLLTLTVLVWTTLKDDVQGGTGIGQYGLAVTGTGLAVDALLWEPLRGLTQ
ncbi:hypothetical protein F5Y01DRAFT_298498 [Xylaria sp. FL0043]|nr:hypothetical protein F5Y01DRAFT_298498 [Xylaria sp. FL0043]